MPSTFAIQKAAQAWCKPETKSIVMDPKLATAFAEILDEAEKPAMGRALRLIKFSTVGYFNDAVDWGQWCRDVARAGIAGDNKKLDELEEKRK